MSPLLAALLISLGATAEKPPVLSRKVLREVTVLAAAAQEGNEPAFLLVCAGSKGLTAGTACRAPAMGTRARRPREGEHTVGRPMLAAPCELTHQKRPAVALQPAAPRGPFLAVWPSSESAQLTPADDLATRVPDSAALVALEAAVKGTPIIDQSLELDLDGDGTSERLISVRKKDGQALLVLIDAGAQAWRPLPTAAGARALRVMATSDLDRDRAPELYVFAQLEAGWELAVIESEKAVSALTCGPSAGPARGPENPR